MSLLAIPRNYADGTKLFESDLDDIKSAIETFFNTTKLDADNFQDNGISLTYLNADIADEVTISKQLTGLEVIDASITTAKIADANVTTAKTADANVTTAKISDGAITSSKFATGSVTTAKIADGTVETGDIATDAVTTVKILDGNVTAAKLNTSSNEVSWVGGRLGDADLNDVGTYRMLFFTSATIIDPGDNVSGINLRPSTSLVSAFRTSCTNSDVGTNVSGTWKYCGAHPIIASAAGAGTYPVGLFVRIS